MIWPLLVVSWPPSSAEPVLAGGGGEGGAMDTVQLSVFKLALVGRPVPFVT